MLLQQTELVLLKHLFPCFNVFRSFYQFTCLLTLATKESCFSLHEELFQQLDGVATGPPTGPNLASIFLCYYEDVWLHDCLLEYKPSY